jgi:hypothetical protein
MMKTAASELLDAARITHHLLFGLPKFLRHSVDKPAYRTILRDRLAARPGNFLRLLETAVYPFPESPSYQLLQAAGCRLEDVKSLVQSDGLERTLEKLKQAGVYLTLDEFKAKTAVKRGSRVYRFSEGDFDNPRLRRHFDVRTGGTRSAGTRTIIDLDFIAAVAVDTAILFDVHDRWKHDHAIWLPLGGAALLLLMTGKVFPFPLAANGVAKQPKAGTEAHETLAS